MHNLHGNAIPAGDVALRLMFTLSMKVTIINMVICPKDVHKC